MDFCQLPPRFKVILGTEEAFGSASDSSSDEFSFSSPDEDPNGLEFLASSWVAKMSAKPTPEM